MKKLLLAATASAVVASGAMAVDFGAGVAFNGTGSTVKMPIDFNANSFKMRVEPELMFGYEDVDDFGKTTQFGIGSGLYMLQNITKDIHMYYGGKIDVSYYDIDPDSGNDRTDTNLGLAGIAGFEYFMSEHASVGGEAGLQLRVGDTTSFGTITAVTLRYYF
jgi:opacity protein-like surface antigen